MARRVAGPGLEGQRLQGGEEIGSSGAELGPVLVREVGKHALAAPGEVDEHAAAIVGIRAPLDEPAAGGAIDELDSAVVVDLEPLGDLTDGGARTGGEAFERQQELVLVGLDARGVGGLLAEPKEAAELESERSEGAVLGLTQGLTRRSHGNISYHDRNYVCQAPSSGLRGGSAFGDAVRSGLRGRPADRDVEA